MAKRGVKPKPAALRVVDGTHRDDRHGEMPEEAHKADPLDKPEELAGPASDAWDKWIDSASWLDWSKEPAAIAFCYLWAEFKSDPDEFQSARHAQMRAYMNELGLTDERNRGKSDDGKKDPGEKYFD